jgi:hypothetical protein
VFVGSLETLHYIPHPSRTIKIMEESCDRFLICVARPIEIEPKQGVMSANKIFAICKRTKKNCKLTRISCLNGGDGHIQQKTI